MAETITLTAEDGNEFSAYRATPSGEAHGGLVVVQEIFGLNDHMRSMADRFAAAGYDVIVPALFDRKEKGIELPYRGDGVARGRALKNGLGWDEPLRDIAAAAAAATALGDQAKIGVVGYCWGGSLAWLVAARLDIACVVAYYGGQICQFRGEKPGCPIELHFGDQDGSISEEHRGLIHEWQPDVPIHVYPGAGHGFNSDDRDDYHAESAALAQKRTLAFLAQHLG